MYSHIITLVCAVSEEDEVSIKEAADMVVEAMNFTGQVVVSFFGFVAMKFTFSGKQLSGHENLRFINAKLGDKRGA